MQVASAKRALCDERNPERWKLAFGHHLPRPRESAERWSTPRNMFCLAS